MNIHRSDRTMKTERHRARRYAIASSWDKRLNGKASTAYHYSKKLWNESLKRSEFFIATFESR